MRQKVKTVQLPPLSDRNQTVNCQQSSQMNRMAIASCLLIVSPPSQQQQQQPEEQQR